MGIFSQSTTPGTSSRKTPRPILAILYEAHFADVVSSVRFFGVPERDAQDVAQDVFVRVHASLHRYDPTRPVGPWLKTIAYRTAQDHVRSAHSRRMRLAPTEDEVEVIDTAATPERRTLLAQMQRVFAEALQDLNEDQRTVYLMNVKDEIPIPEIAAALEQPENTVRSRLHRAHQALDAAVARRRTMEEQRHSALAPMLVPAMLADAARKGFDGDPGAKAIVWSQLARLLGLGIIGKLAPLSGAAIVVGAALLVAMGTGAGAWLHAALEKRAPAETLVRAAMDGTTGGTASPSTVASAEATASATTTTAMVSTSTSASANAAEVDAGAIDLAAQMRAETAILAKARDAMESEHYETALRELKRHERLFPYGRLAEQRRDMLRVVQAELRRKDGGTR